MSLPRIFIIILNWEGVADTIKCIESLKKIVYPDFKIVVVDNNSSGNDVQILKKKYTNEVHLISNQKNFGFAGGNNKGIAYALEQKGDYILLLNNDTIVTANFLNILVKVFNKDPKIGIVGPRILLPNGQIQPECARKLPRLLDQFFFHSYINLIFKNSKLFNRSLASHNHQVDCMVEAISGASMLVKSELFTKVGLLDENFFVYGEDLDFCKRVLDCGYKIYFCSSSIIKHNISQSIPKTRYKGVIEGFISDYRYYLKHYGIFQADLYKLMIRIIYPFRLLILDPILFVLAKIVKYNITSQFASFSFLEKILLIKNIFRWKSLLDKRGFN